MTSPSGDGYTLSFELPNVGVGPDPLSVADLVSDVDFAVMVFLRDYHCPHCQEQVNSLSQAASDFNQHNTAVVPVLPESRERAAKWRDSFDRPFPFPLLADAHNRVADQYNQPTRYGIVGQIHDILGRLPKTVILDTRGDEAEVVYTHSGKGVTDRPDIEDLLATVRDLQETFVFDCMLVDC